MEAVLRGLVVPAVFHAVFGVCDGARDRRAVDEQHLGEGHHDRSEASAGDGNADPRIRATVHLREREP